MPSQRPKYATLPKGSLWPFQEVDKDEVLEESSAYKVKVVTKGSSSELSWTSENGDEESTAMPHRYNELMKRFIWRGDILTALLRSPTYMGDINDACTEKAMVNNLRYHLDVFKELRISLRAAAASVDPQPVVRLLEVYMLEEFYVGRHDPAAVLKWQMAHAAINLRCTDIFTLGT